MFTVLFNLLDETQIVASFIEAATPHEAMGIALQELMQKKPTSGLDSVQVFSLHEVSAI
jgi:hypothetical protein